MVNKRLKLQAIMPSLTMVFFSLLLILSSCGQKGSGTNQRDSGPVQVDGYTVTTEKFTVNIRATGELLPYEEVELKTPVSGNVMRINFREGQYVGKGELLVEIDNRSLRARKGGLEARLAASESELVRMKRLLEIDGVSLEIAEQTEAEVDNLKSQIEELKVMIDLAHIRAPFSGRLGMRNFSTGAYLSQGEVITRLVQSDKLKVNFGIPAKYAAFAAAGQEITMISSSTGDTAVAKIYATDPMIRQSSRNIIARASFDNKANKFLPGDFVQILLAVEQNNKSLLVPAEAIIPELNSQVVYVADKGKARRQVVETGSRTNTRVQITKGLSPGDVVITTGLMTIRDGAPVVVREKKAEVAR